MPKRATHTFESEKDGVKESALPVQYCMCCGESVLILGPDVALADLPRRRTDGAIVLERGKTEYRLNSKRRETKVLKRPNGYERQYRFGCWNCGITLGYRAEEGEDAALTYLLPDATGQQADLYLQMYQVPQCIQSTGPSSVRVAVEVKAGQPKRALLSVDADAVNMSVTAPAREGLANAELLEFVQKVIAVPRAQLQLSRGWSLSSKFLIVTGLQPVDVFKRLKAAVDTESVALGPNPEPVEDSHGVLHQAVADPTTGVNVGVASGIARQGWENNEQLDELAEAPSLKQQTFIK